MSLECASALARLERNGALETCLVTQNLQQFYAVRGAWSNVPPLEVVHTIAQRLTARAPLRAADALQLAAAPGAADYRPQAWEFVCLDTRLAGAAQREGFRGGI